MRNLKFAFRTLFKARFVTSVAVLSLALGIGATAAIFSLFDQVLLRALPVANPGRLVNLAAPGPKPGSQSCNQAGDCDVVFSYPMFRDLEREPQVFTGLAAHRAFGANLVYQGQTATGDGMLVSGGYFTVLGLTPELGRLLGPEDDRAVGESHVAVLSYDYWRTRFGASPAALNQMITINGQPMTIVGVAPRGFNGTTLGTQPKVFVPVTMRGFMEPGFKDFDNRRSYWIYVFARLKPGVSIDQARASINLPYHHIINDVEAPLQKGMSQQTLARFRQRLLDLQPGPRGQSDVPDAAGTALTLLLVVTGVVLVIACANIANLLLVRSAGRSTEMAVRLSIGAGRAHLVGQLLVESCLLAVFGGAAGLLVAHWTLQLIASTLPPDRADMLTFSLDWRVLAFAGAVTLATGVLFGLFPALHSTRPDLASILKGTSGQPSGARTAKWYRIALATTQIALSMALLAAAGLVTKSLANISRVDLGLKVDRLVMFSISPELSGYTPDRSRALFLQSEDRLAAIPGVTSVSAGLVPLLAGDNWGSDVSVEGFQGGPDVDANSRYNEVGPGYFRTLGVPLIAGREFTRSDVLDGRKVAIVNETFAKKFHLGHDAVGKLMANSTGNAVKLDTEIVGLVQDAKYSDVKQKVPPVFFRPYLQDKDVGGMTFYVRTAADPGPILTAIPKIMASLDPDLPIRSVQTMAQQVRDNVSTDRLVTTLSAAFAMLATVLAAVGLYGVLAYTVAQRTREFGLRMALGADPRRVRRMVLGQVGWMTLAGAGVGLAAVIWLSKYAESLLFELKGRDPAVLAGAAVLLTLVALAAGFIPAFRASRLDPMRALRYE